MIRLTLLALFAVAAAAADGPVPVVAANAILADFVRQVGGERVQVATLIAAGHDAHEHAATPAQAASVHAARLVVVNGLGLDDWVAQLADGAPGIRILAAGDAAAAGAGDPHAWQDARQAEAYAAAIADALATVDPSGADDYRAWSTLYRAQLRALDAWLRREAAAIPAERRHLVTGHQAFTAFAAAYGFTAHAPRGASPEAAPDAQAVAALIATMRQAGIAVVFPEIGGEDPLLRQLCDATGARLGPPLTIDTLGAPGSPTGTYIDAQRTLMRSLVRTLR